MTPQRYTYLRFSVNVELKIMHKASNFSCTVRSDVANPTLSKTWAIVSAGWDSGFLENEIFKNVQKFSFDKSPKSSRVFHPNFFWTIFLVKSKLSTAKQSKTTTFSRVFHPKKNRQFSREIKVEFLNKKWRFRTVCYCSLKKKLTFLHVAEEVDCHQRLFRSLR